MKSPNERTSMRLLETASQAIDNVRQDLKNDQSLIEDGTTASLQWIEKELNRIINALQLKGYSK